MSRENYNHGVQAEYLSPWSSGKGWSFNPQKISVFSPRPVTKLESTSVRNGSPDYRNSRSISTTQIITLGLVVLSLGLLAAIVALLMG